MSPRFVLAACGVEPIKLGGVVPAGARATDGVDRVRVPSSSTLKSTAPSASTRSTPARAAQASLGVADPPAAQKRRLVTAPVAPVPPATRRSIPVALPRHNSTLPKSVVPRGTRASAGPPGAAASRVAPVGAGPAPRKLKATSDVGDGLRISLARGGRAQAGSVVPSKGIPRPTLAPSTSADQRRESWETTGTSTRTSIAPAPSVLPSPTSEPRVRLRNPSLSSSLALRSRKSSPLANVRSPASSLISTPLLKILDQSRTTSESPLDLRDLVSKTSADTDLLQTSFRSRTLGQSSWLDGDGTLDEIVTPWKTGEEDAGLIATLMRDLEEAERVQRETDALLDQYRSAERASLTSLASEVASTRRLALALEATHAHRTAADRYDALACAAQAERAVLGTQRDALRVLCALL